MTRPVFFFGPEAYSTKGEKLMGRQAAGEGFLAAYVRHGSADRFECYAASKEHAVAFTALCDQFGRGGRPTQWIPFGDLNRLRDAGALLFPGPVLGPLAWRREDVGSSAYSICGVTHTIASAQAMDAIMDLLIAPIEPWDALICTSSAVRDSVNRLLARYGEYLQSRLDATRVPEIARPLIPLGADCGALAPDAEARAKWREKLGIASEDVAFLYMGRLSYHAKANPFPMYRALEKAARECGHKVHLIQTGWFANSHIESVIRQSAAEFAPSVNIVYLDGRDSKVRREIWSAADVFTSLVDNVQETFGLAPVEAMAAGLPCVVTDWDGYKDTVRNGIDGFRIPTLAPPAGSASDISARFDDGVYSYDRYIGACSLLVAVDIPACADAYRMLATDAGMRARMGAAARQRARMVFDWSVIVAKYQELWNELGKCRLSHAAKPAAGGNLKRPEPFRLFASYATRSLQLDDRIRIADGSGADAIARLNASELVRFVPEVVPEPGQCADVMALLQREPGLTPREVSDRTGLPLISVVRVLGWFAKVGAIVIEAPPKPRTEPGAASTTNA